MKIKGTVSTNDFNAQGNNSRIAINNGDDHIQITDNTYAFDHAAIGYLGHLSLLQVITAAYHEKRAQDKTTVRKSEFHFPSDGPKTDQTDNVLAVATTPFVRNTLERRVREDCTDRLTDFAENITYDHLDRMTDATLVGASTAAASCDDLGTNTNRTSNSGLSDSGGRRLCNAANRSSNAGVLSHFFKNFEKK